MDEPIEPARPARPTEQIQAELVEILNADESLLGEVYRREQAGETPADIQAARGATRPNFVWHYERVIKTLLDGDLPTARTVVRSNARAIRSLLRSVALSQETEQYLRANLTVLEERLASIREKAEAEDEDEIEDEVEEEVEATHEFQVYAWTYSGIPVLDASVRIGSLGVARISVADGRASHDIPVGTDVHHAIAWSRARGNPIEVSE